MFRHELKKALWWFGALDVQQSTQADVEQACEHLGNWYRRLHYLDKMNIIIRTDKQSKGEQQIPMTDEQIK